MLEGEVPYGDIHPMRAMMKVLKCGLPPLKKPEECSSELRDLIARCTKEDPLYRPTANELLSVRK
jgi:serine/threonine protein kinase